jgi:hypothetical protein
MFLTSPLVALTLAWQRLLQPHKSTRSEVPHMNSYQQDLTRPLKAWCVGDFNLYAAEDAAQALTLACNVAGPASYTLDDVVPAPADLLDERLADASGTRLSWTLRGLLVDAKAPGHLASYE